MAAPFTNLTHYEPTIAEIELLFAFQPTYAYVGDVPIRREINGTESWGAGPVFLTPDADTLASCNAEVLLSVFRTLVGPPRSEDAEIGMWEVITVAHWGRGAIEHFAVKVYDAEGNLTPAARLLLGVINRFRGNPALDPGEYRKRVAEAALEATLAHIEEIGSEYLVDDVPDDWAARVFGLIAKRAPEEVQFDGENGAEPSEKVIIGAMKGLGYFDRELEG